MKSPIYAFINESAAASAAQYITDGGGDGGAGGTGVGGTTHVFRALPNKM